MSDKTTLDHFLRKELKALADSRGDTAIDEQAVFDDALAKNVKVKNKKTK